MISISSLTVLAAVVFMPIAILYAWRQRFGLARSVISILLALYLAAVVGVTLGPLPVDGGFDKGFAGEVVGVNLIPLRTIALYFAEGVSLSLASRQLGGNLLLLMPLGFLLPILSVRVRSLGKVAAAAFLVSVAIELLQVVVILTLGNVARAIDVDDVLLNVSGAMVGWILWRLATAIGSRAG